MPVPANDPMSDAYWLRIQDERVTELEAKVELLRSAIEEYRLWRPGGAMTDAEFFAGQLQTIDSLRAENEELRKDRAAWRDRTSQLFDEREAARAEVKRLRERIGELEAPIAFAGNLPAMRAEAEAERLRGVLSETSQRLADEGYAVWSREVYDQIGDL